MSETDDIEVAPTEIEFPSAACADSITSQSLDESEQALRIRRAQAMPRVRSAEELIAERHQGLNMDGKQRVEPAPSPVSPVKLSAEQLIAQRHQGLGVPVVHAGFEPNLVEAQALQERIRAEQAARLEAKKAEPPTIQQRLADHERRITRLERLARGTGSA